MRLDRHHIAGIGTAAAHAGVVGWLLLRTTAPETAPPPPRLLPIVLLDVDAPREAPLAIEDHAVGSAPVDTPSSPAAAALPDPIPAPPSPPRPRRRARSVPRPEPVAEPTADPGPIADPIPGSGPAAADDPSPIVADAAPPRANRRASGPSRSSGTGHGSGTSAGSHPFDHSAYGARIVELVMDEIDARPVPGISPRASVELLLRISPTGRLLRVGTGRFDYARVIRSSVGPLRTRQLLSRVLRASQRFPAHPKGFARDYYVVGITVNFRGT